MKIIGLTDRKFVNTVIRKRPRDVHKGDCGKVLLVCGSVGMAGAAVLCSKAAMRSGSGLVKVCTDSYNFPILQISVPEVICTQWDDVKDDLLQYDAVAIGPGMGVDDRTKKILRDILIGYDKTIVIDADGLNAVSESGELQTLIAERSAPIIMTPHIVEAGRLLRDRLGDRSARELDKLTLADMIVKKYGCVAVIKGADTLVAVSQDEAYTNITGNPGMATAGSGDVLTGIIASFAGQGMSAEDAARAGVFVHGMSGNFAADSLGEYGLIAGDIINNLPLALKDLID
ncbi:MAG: NAD(P)H-hydrate dehydratase [Eubacteriaceae bacterium]|nr:NAD(P)H-hydrate dehydratase [Eubacteriaceae bacterium]